MFLSVSGHDLPIVAPQLRRLQSPITPLLKPQNRNLKISSLTQYLISPLAIIIGVEFITWWYSKELAVWCGGWLVALIALTAGNAISVATSHSSYTEFPFSYRSEHN